MLSIYLDVPVLTKEYRLLVMELLSKALDEGPALPCGFASRYCFSVYLPRSHFREEIELETCHIKVILSTGDRETYLRLGEALGRLRGCCLTLGDSLWHIGALLPVTPKPIPGSPLTIRMLSPLLLPREGGCFQLQDEGFTQALRCQTACQLEALGADPGLSQELTVLSCGRDREVHVLHQGVIYRATVGELMLSGPQGLLACLYHYGLGSRRSEGFGLFEISAQA